MAFKVAVLNRYNDIGRVTSLVMYINLGCVARGPIHILSPFCFMPSLYSLFFYCIILYLLVSFPFLENAYSYIVCVKGLPQPITVCRLRVGPSPHSPYMCID